MCQDLGECAKPNQDKRFSFIYLIGNRSERKIEGIRHRRDMRTVKLVRIEFIIINELSYLEVRLLVSGCFRRNGAPSMFHFVFLRVHQLSFFNAYPLR